MKTLILNRKITLLIVTAMLLIYGIHGTSNVQAQNNAPELTPVSDRTQQVQDTIVALVPGVDAADDVTAAHLALITSLNLSNQSITTLKAGDFDGLSALRSLSLAKNTLTSLPADIFSGLSAMSSLDLGSNELSSLPANIFSGLSSMSRLNLSHNSLDSLPANTFSGLSTLTGLDLGNNQLSSLPANIFSGLSSLNWLSLSSNQLSSLPDGLFSGVSSLNSLYLGDNTVGLSITVSLAKVGANQFKATTATGAPFSIVLPITVTNGSVDGGATTTTIPAGSVESGLLTVTRTAGTTADLTVDIGTLPELPTSHYGYSLVKPSSADNTLSFVVGIPKPTDDPNVNHAPIFTEGSSTTRSIAENTPAGTDIGSPVSATDADEDVLTYTLSGADAASFGIVSTTGQLQTHAPLDYKKKNTYAVTVTVSDGSATDTISVTIDVTDVEENNAPVFTEGSSTERSIPENTPAGRNIGAPVSATDLDEDVLTYTLSGVDAASFGIVSTTGQLRTRAPLDYEQKNAYAVTVSVSDGNGGTDSISVAINVTDVEENNAPVFVEGSSTERSIPENTPAGRNVGAPVSATDLDEDVLTYTLSGVDAASFGIVSTTGQLKTRAPLDYEQKNTYSVAVHVSDSKGGTDSIGVAINVTDVNENNDPVFVEGSATERSIPENTPAGRNIGAPVSATDLDEDVLTYTLGGADAASFGIVSTTGQLRTRAPLDYEQKNTYSVAVFVSDGNGGTDSIGVAINVTDIAETEPEVAENTAPVFAEGTTTRSIPENTPAGRNIGDVVAATDVDSDDTLTYTLGGTDAASFDIDRTTGQLKTKAALDYETKNAYAVTVTVSDGSLTATIVVIITIIDVDESTNRAPVFEGDRARSIRENTPAGVDIGAPVSATDPDSDVLVYSLEGPDAAAFTIVGLTGQLKTRAPLDYETKRFYTVKVTVTDGRLTNTITVIITIIDVDETLPTVPEGLLLYWTADAGRTSTIRRMDLINGQIQDVVTGLGSLPPNDIAVDPLGRKVYWSDDYLADRIQRANFDGTYRQDVVGNLNPTGIALDVLGGKIYWATGRWGMDKIQRADLDGANVEDVITGLDATDVAIDVLGGKIYWTSGGWPKDSGKIQRADLDGANVEDVVTGLDEPTYIDIDVSGGRIYWVDDGEGKIQRANLDGTDIKDVVTGFIWSTGIALDVSGGKIYWTNTVKRKIQRADLDGANVEDVVTGLKISTLFPAISVAAISHKTTLTLDADINGDGSVNIQDLVLVASNLGQTGENVADVNGDGIVNIADLVLVAGALGSTTAAPSLHPQALEMLTATDVKQWLSAAQRLNLTDTTSQRGILFLQQLLITLTPKETSLLPNYPNPFNPETWIPYRLAEDAFVALTIYDQHGRVVRRLNVGHQTASVYESRSKAIHWDGRNEVGDQVASGIYFYTLTAGDYSATRKMLILK